MATPTETDPLERFRNGDLSELYGVILRMYVWHIQNLVYMQTRSSLASQTTFFSFIFWDGKKRVWYTHR